MKNSDLYSIFHNSTITANLLQILEIFLGIHLVYENTVFPQFWYDQFKSFYILVNVQWKLAKQLKNNDFCSIFHNSTITANMFEIFENASNVFDI